MSHKESKQKSIWSVGWPVLVFSLLMLFLSARIALPAAAQDEAIRQVEGQSDLEPVKRAKFRNTYVNTDADFSQYNKLFLGEAFFDYRDVGEAQRYRSNIHTTSHKSLFGIPESERQKFEETIDEAFMKEFENAKNFTIVEELGPNTMILRGAVVDIVSRVPPELIGRSELYLATVGEATLVMEFLDGQTGEVLARIAERRSIGRGQIDMATMPANSVTIWAEVRRWAGSAARRLRAELDLAMGG